MCDAVTGIELLSISTPYPWIVGLDWSPDGSHFMYDDHDVINLDTVEIRPIWQNTEELIAYTQECCVVYDLTPDERELFGLPPVEETLGEPEASRSPALPYVMSLVTFGLAAVGLRKANRQSNRQ